MIAIAGSDLEMTVEGEEPALHGRPIHQFGGREAIGELFAFTFVVTFSDLAPTAEEILGQRIQVVMSRGGLVVRRIHGMVSEVRVLKAEAEGELRYRLTLVPRAWRLTAVTTQEIYMDLSLPDLLRRKLAEVGLERHTEFRLARDYPALEFVVQYRESDLAFVLRLCERHGLALTIEHDEDHDRVVFSDHNHGFRRGPGLSWPAVGETGDLEDVEATQRLVPRWYGVYDYNYRAPTLELSAASDTGGRAGGVTEYAVHVKTPEEAERLADTRAGELRGRRLVIDGRSHHFGIRAGTLCRLQNVPPWLEHEEIIVTSVRYAMVEAEGSAKALTCSFEAQPTDHVYRPPRKTPRPRIHGVLSGVIEGDDPAAPDGGIARLDDQGRYRVRFHFDTAEPHERKASRRVRMAQPYAGPGQGMHFPLRPGTEVLLVFLDGDPDRPIIVGAVPNVLTASPVARESAHHNRIATASGVMFEIIDGR
ncbi:MAG: type VI secretion system tip protein TssI/VgrG [Myxococcota bacterium]